MSTGWNARVYAAVKRIPRGRVATYGEIGLLLGRARAGRQVGWALASCDDPGVPCHRVVDRNGRLAPGFREQRARLRAERVPFSGELVDLRRARWSPRRALAPLRID